MTGNIKEARLRTITNPISKLTICAHDTAGTRVQYFKVQGFVVVNDRGLFIEHGDNLHSAIGDMWAITGISARDYTFITETWG